MSCGLETSFPCRCSPQPLRRGPDDFLFSLRQIQHARFRDRLGFERFVNGKAKNEWETTREAGAHFVNRVDSMIGNNAMLFRGRVAACRGLLLEGSFIYNIRPLLLRTDSLLSQ